MYDVTNNNQQVKDIACSLCDKRNVNVFSIERGRNSRIYRVEEGNNIFALKFFRTDKEGRRERFEAETSALHLFEENELQMTPRIIVKDKENNCILMEWIEGEQVEHFGANEIESLTAFVQQVHGIACRKSDQEIRYATEACLNGGEIVRQINERLVRLDISKGQYPELCKFIDEEFIPALNEISIWSQRQYEAAGLSFLENISFKQQTLSLVDIGCHNTLQKDNKLYFLDFEFFGWDDPVKLVADTLQHPGMTLDDENKKTLFLNFVKTFDKDENFLIRLKALYPLFGLKWCMIMLNIFLPEYVMATRSSITKEDQLMRVRNLIGSICKNYQEFLYGKEYSKIS